MTQEQKQQEIENRIDAYEAELGGCREVILSERKRAKITLECVDGCFTTLHFLFNPLCYCCDSRDIYRWSMQGQDRQGVREWLDEFVYYDDVAHAKIHEAVRTLLKGKRKNIKLTLENKREIFRQGKSNQVKRNSVAVEFTKDEHLLCEYTFRITSDKEKLSKLCIDIEAYEKTIKHLEGEERRKHEKILDKMDNQTHKYFFSVSLSHKQLEHFEFALYRLRLLMDEHARLCEKNDEFWRGSKR